MCFVLHLRGTARKDSVTRSSLGPYRISAKKYFLKVHSLLPRMTAGLSELREPAVYLTRAGQQELRVDHGGKQFVAKH